MSVSDDEHGLIRQARLLVCHPEEVFPELKAYGQQITKSFLKRDRDLERALLARAEPLIDLGLARYASDEDVVKALYQKATATPTDPQHLLYQKGLRVACLSNHSVGGWLDKFPNNVLGIDETRRVLTDAESDEACALLGNPTIAPLLEALYLNKEPCDLLTDEQRWILVRYSARNPRLVDCRDDDEGPDLTHSGIQRAIVSLLRNAPTTQPWLVALYDLLRPLDCHLVASMDTDSFNSILSRWNSVAAGDGAAEMLTGHVTSLPLKDEFRCLIGALYGETYENKKMVVHGQSDAEDIAKRCACYANAKLDAKAIEAGYARDKEVFSFAVLLNDSVLSDRRHRQLLEDKCISGGELVWHYRNRCEQLHKRREWFNPKPLSEWLGDENSPKNEQQSAEPLASLVRAANGKLQAKVDVLLIVAALGAVIVFVPWLTDDLVRRYALGEDLSRWLAIGFVVVGVFGFARWIDRKSR